MLQRLFREPLHVTMFVAGFAVFGCSPALPRPALDWAALETSASERLKTRPSEGSNPVERIDTGEPFQVNHRFKVEGGNCYDAALAWAFDKKVSVKILYGLDGQKPINSRVRHVSAAPIGPKVGGVSFCVDDSGDVGLELRPIVDRSSLESMTLDQRPLYALAVAYRKETEADKVTRHAREDKEAFVLHEQFVADSDALHADQARDKQNKGCRSCRAEHRKCKAKGFILSTCDEGYDRCLRRASIDAAACSGLPD